MKYVTVLTIRDLFTKVSSPLGSSGNPVQVQVLSLAPNKTTDFDTKSVVFLFA